MAKIKIQNRTKMAFKQCNHLFPWSCTSMSGEELLWCPDCGSTQWPRMEDWIRPVVNNRTTERRLDLYNKHIQKELSV